MPLTSEIVTCAAWLLALHSESALPPLEARAWREDLQFLAEKMERNHKSLYHTTSREQFTASVAALDERIPSLERHEVIVEMAKIVASVGDGHTNIYPTRDARIGFHSLPLALTFFGDELYIRATPQSRRSLLGARVRRIGDRTVAEAFAAVKQMIGRDNEQGARYWAQYLLAMPEVLHAFRITPTIDAVPLTLSTSHGERVVTLRAFEPVEIMTGDKVTLFNRRPGWIDVRDLSGEPDPAWLRGATDAFHFEHLGPLLYVQINTIADTPEETLAQFSSRLRDEIAATKPGKVAIDLRLNRGGNGMLNVALVRALVQSVSVDRKGHLFAIIGPATFSAAQMLADALEKYTNVTFVGEPSGSKGNAYGDSRKITLPNSGITVRASIYYWQDWHPQDTRDAITPRIPAPLTFEAYRDNVDPAIEAIERL
jgi:C-terminal processing protease CtpA/Prc